MKNSRILLFTIIILMFPGVYMLGQNLQKEGAEIQQLTTGH